MAVYHRLEGLRWQDAFFWITHPHSMEYRHVHDSTKFFAFFVYLCVFAFQIWIAERVLVTIFRRQGMEAWKAIINDVRLEKVREHFAGAFHRLRIRPGGPHRGRPTQTSRDPVGVDRNQ